MPKSKSSSGKALGATAAFAPLALSLLLGNATIGGGNSDAAKRGTTAAVCEEEGIEGFRDCHASYPTGCTKAGRYDAMLNLFKNQLVPPTKEPVRFLSRNDFAELEKNTPRDLTKGNHDQHRETLGKLGEGQVVGMLGYLYYAMKGGTSESSNCQLGDMDDIDFHIGIGFEEKIAAKMRKKPSGLSQDEKSSIKPTSVVVEMTPHQRARFHPQWGLDLLKPAIGRQVRLAGQLLADNEHNRGSDNCALPGASEACWRASIWELHPVTRFQVCPDSATPCTETSDKWVELEDFEPGK